MLSPEHLHDPILPYVNREVVTLHPELTVAQALARIAEKPAIEQIVYFYVIDHDGRLLGVVGTRRLLFAPRDANIGSLMDTDVTAIPGWATVLVASEFFVNRRFLAFPVVDEAGRLIGAVDIELFNDQVIGMARQFFDDIFSLTGVHATPGRTIWGAFRDRFPWLLCNVGGGLLAAFVASRYEALLTTFVVLALFVPVVLALAESVSIQSVTLTLQTLHRGTFEWKLFARSVRRELAVATLLGLGCGSLVMSAAWMWKAHGVLALAIGGAIWLSMITACLLGLALPTAVHAIKGNAHIAAGPIVLAAADMATLLFYFQGAAWLASRW